MRYKGADNMNNNSEYSIETKCIQAGWQPKNGEPRVLPIYQSTTYKYETSDEMGKLFDLEAEGYFYTIWLRRRFASWRAEWQRC